MTREHTPGPWHAIIDGQNSRKPKRDPHPMAMVRAGGTQCIDATGSGDTFDEASANARLIAAAPDMLAALHEIEASVYGRKEKPSDHAKYLGDIARAAIAKATT